MYSIILLCLFALLSLACAATKSKNVEQNALSQNVINKSSPKTTPTPMSINDADYIATELAPDKIKKTTLDNQPQEIIEYILQGERAEKKFGSSLKEIKIQVEDHDIDYDGTNERILVAKFYGNESIPVLYIFKSENGKWNSCIFEIDLGDPNENPFKVEFLRMTNKSDFSLIKTSEEYGDKEIMKDITYYRMQNGKYERFECHKVEGAVEKTVLCN